MPKTQGVAAVQRALAILDTFAGAGSRSLADIAKITGLAKPTVMRSLVSLDEAGYVVRLSDGRYALGAKTFQLAPPIGPISISNSMCCRSFSG